MYLSEELDGSFSTETYLSENETLMASFPKEREWLLYMPKAYHPLMLQQHRQNVQKAKKEGSNAPDVSYTGLMSNIHFLLVENVLSLFFPLEWTSAT